MKCAWRRLLVVTFIFVFMLKSCFMNFYFIVFLFHFFFFLNKEKFNIFNSRILHFSDCKQNVGAVIKTFDVHLWPITPVHFLSKGEKVASYEGRDGWNICFFFPAIVGILTLVLFFIKVLFPICTLLWRANIYLLRQEKQERYKWEERKQKRHNNDIIDILKVLLFHCWVLTIISSIVPTLF